MPSAEPASRSSRSDQRRDRLVFGADPQHPTYFLTETALRFTSLDSRVRLAQGRGNHMPQGKRHVLAAIVTVAAAGLLAGGCSAHVSVGGTTVPKHSVETEVATTLAKQENQPVPKVVCPKD